MLMLFADDTRILCAIRELSNAQRLKLTIATSTPGDLNGAGAGQPAGANAVSQSGIRVGYKAAALDRAYNFGRVRRSWRWYLPRLSA